MTKEEMLALCTEVHSYGIHMPGKERAVELQIDASMMTEDEADTLAKWVNHGVKLIVKSRQTVKQDKSA